MQQIGNPLLYGPGQPQTHFLRQQRLNLITFLSFIFYVLLILPMQFLAHTNTTCHLICSHLCEVSYNTGCTMAQWLALSSHYEKALVRIPRTIPQKVLRIPFSLHFLKTMGNNRKQVYSVLRITRQWVSWWGTATPRMKRSVSNPQRRMSHIESMTGLIVWRPRQRRQFAWLRLSSGLCRRSHFRELGVKLKSRFMKHMQHKRRSVRGEFKNLSPTRSRWLHSVTLKSVLYKVVFYRIPKRCIQCLLFWREDINHIVIKLMRSTI